MKCYHCGDECPPSNTITYEEHPFCCYGCRTVYEIIQSNSLDDYYQLENAPGLKIGTTNNEQYAFLDDEDIKKQWILFDNDEITKFLSQFHKYTVAPVFGY